MEKVQKKTRSGPDWLELANKSRIESELSLPLNCQVTLSVPLALSLSIAI